MVTIRDVARAANVSAQTVSRAFSGRGYVSAEARARVEQAARTLGYVPNRVASSLATGQTKTIGIVVPDITSVYFAEIVTGAEHAARKAGYNTILCDASEISAKEKDLLHLLYEARVDGVIVVSPRLEEDELLPALAWHRAAVTINRPLPLQLAGDVHSDHAGGTALAVQHLARSGRRTVAYMTGPARAFAARERLRGFVQAMKDAGLTLRPELIVPYLGYVDESVRDQGELLRSLQAGSPYWRDLHHTIGRLGALGLLSTYPKVDSLVCYDDGYAIGALRACRELGRRVPDDVALIGCNDIPLIEHLTPALTTQRVPCYQMGARAAEILIERIAGRCPEPAVFAHELIIRESAPAPDAE
jgi:LacI family transcriptional regulator